ncbi:response regulator [Pseudoxanthomonas daejeonensis]|uniref:Response regulator n=1 Tax=Pseudoxanthomonas daejeonensis TaxID=266062 RepID=A0ABQ6Z6C6_9GAMM|nr:response regulator [Pseudoxanthomonas daejeonensis]KAF1694092.1 response regulator [Pseudoxanthomonas daejeonensis]UNK57246.1 response regulator [Pseudoxanthomonas daejeonensis]
MPRLLYVEDDELLQMVTTIALEEAGFEVTQASNGHSARELLAANEGFDYVVSDISMPGGVTGVDVAEAALQARPSCRTVLISGYALAQLPTLPANAQFLEKPYHVRDLLAALGGN